MDLELLTDAQLQALRETCNIPKPAASLSLPIIPVPWIRAYFDLQLNGMVIDMEIARRAALPA